MSEARKVLSPRQAECMRRVRALQSSDQIARELNISTGTINGYIREAVVALGARDRRHAALIFEGMERADADDLEEEIEKAEVASGDDCRSSHPEPPPSIVRDVWTGGLELEPETNLRRVYREIVSGSRPDDWSMVTRSALILAAVVVIGIAILVMSASLGIVYSLASAIRSATG